MKYIELTSGAKLAAINNWRKQIGITTELLSIEDYIKCENQLMRLGDCFEPNGDITVDYEGSYKGMF